MNQFRGVILLIKICFYVKIAEIWLFRHNLLMVFFLDILWKLVFCKTHNMGWPSNITWNIKQRCLVKWLKPPALMAPIDTLLQKKHSSYQEYHLTKMAPNLFGASQKWHLKKTASHKNGISKLTLLVFWSTTNTLLIEPIPTIIHQLKKHDFKITWQWA